MVILHHQAADGRPVVDYEDTYSATLNPDMSEFQPYDHSSTALWTVDSTGIDYTNNTVTLTGNRANNMRSRYCLMYYPNPGDNVLRTCVVTVSTTLA